MKIEANGITINYVIEGPQEAPVVTLSHSLAASLEMWEPQVPVLKDRYRILRYDSRGHGSTDAPEGPYTLTELAEDARALLAALGIDRTHFVGLSMGGMVAQQLAVSHPGLCQSLVLADTLSRYPPEAVAMWQERIQSASGPDGMAPLADPTIERWFTPTFRLAHPRTIEWIHGLILRTPSQGFIGCCHALMQLDLTSQLSTVDVPALVLVGREDPTTPVAGAEVIRDALGSAELVVIEDAAHLSNIEQPEAFNSALLDFLERRASAA